MYIESGSILISKASEWTLPYFLLCVAIRHLYYNYHDLLRQGFYKKKNVVSLHPGGKIWKNLV
jgi:hypothetical protein